MKIANGIYMLEIEVNIMGTSSVINPMLIWDKDTLILVDTGYPGQLVQIHQAIEETNASFDKLNMIILTHQDIDHIGGLASILKELPSNNIKVIAHEEEKAYIQGDKIPVKVKQLEEKFALLPEAMKGIYEKLKGFYENNKVAVDKALTHGEELPYGGGITVIYTPGHTPGHICLYLKQHKILIAGDALFIEDGVLIKPGSAITFDMDLSIKSLKKLTEYDIETVVCYHGGIYKDNVNKRIAELAKSLEEFKEKIK